MMFLKVIRVVACISSFLFTAEHYCVVRTYHILSNYQLGNSWIISSLGLLWIKLLWTIMFKSWCGQMFLFTFGKYIKWSCWVKWFFFFFLACRILVSWTGIEPGPQKWKYWMLTIGPPRNSLVIVLFNFIF